MINDYCRKAFHPNNHCQYLKLDGACVYSRSCEDQLDQRQWDARNLYEIDVYVRDAGGNVIRQRRFTIEAKAGETLEVWVDDHLKYEEEAEEE